MTVFYAWQNDTDSKVCRYFIRDALVAALSRIASDLQVEDSPRLDSDTVGVSGTPDIASTIFRKIDDCAVFIADLSFVGSTSDGKVLPNPNVLIELGYASAKIGWDRIVCVMNLAFGQPDELPFDLRNRRWPIDFDLPTGSVRETRNAVKPSLASVLTSAIKGALQTENNRIIETLGRLDHSSIEALKENAEYEWFSKLPPSTMGQALAGAHKQQAIPKLVELNLVSCHPDDGEYGHRYMWTPLGIQVLQKLGFRPRP